jgi:hypothetical protein
MDSPINRMIDRSSNRKVASPMKAKAKRTKALNDQVLSLVHEANATALPERHVTPRAALIVMARAMKELSSLPEESRTHGVLREVSKFISLNQKTLLASASIKHVDLLPKGHPLSPLNASLTEEELRKKYSEWIAADPAIADEARSLVAMAHSLPPESIEREHAFLRLRTLQASAVPAYFKIDDVTAITAAFSSGNSSAARRARVALQWRDRFGQWIEMGRGVNFRFRMPDGSVATGKGNYVGAGSNPIVERTSTGTSLTSESGLIEVSGVPGLAPGLYAINSNNAAAYQARIPGFEAPQAPSFDDQFDADVPSIEDLKAARRDLPIGWKKQGPYFVSDDNYAVIPGPNGQPQSVTRLNADGRPAATVGNARSWSEVNDLIDKDQPSFDKEIARIEAEGEEGQLPLARIPGATEEDVVDFDDIVNMQKKRAEENKKFEASRPAAKPLGDKDLNGNVVPNSWTRDANDDKAYTRQMPLRDGGTYPLSARVTEDGKYVAGHAAGWIPEPGTDGRGAQRKFESWKEIESAIPEFVDYLNGGFTKDNPIVEEDKNAIMYYIDKDGNKVSGPAPETEPTTPEQVKKAEQDIRKNMEKNLPPREFPQEPRDDRYDARIVTEDLVEIDKSTLDALNKRMRKDSTGEYNMEGVTFSPDNNGNIVMYPDAWEPGDKIIGRIEDDGGIDWESDEQYDKYAEKVSEALRGLGAAPAEPPSGPENSVSKEVFNGLKNKIAEENKGGYSKSGLYFFHDLIGPDDGALSKDITFMIDEDEEFSPLGTISSDGTITWNDPSKQEDWAPALESALKSFTEGKDKFTKNKNTGYMEYDLGDGYVVSYGKDEDGNWSAEMNRFSRDGGLDSENSFPAKSEADARAMAEGLIDRYNDSQEWEGGDGDGGGFDLGDYENSPEFIKQANETTKDWPTMDYATYINDKDPEFEEHKYMPLPEGSKLVATGLNGEDGNQLLVKLPDGNYILANDVLGVSDEDMKNNVGIPAFEQIVRASDEEPGGGYGENNLSWEDMTLERLTSGDPYTGFDRLDDYGFFERFGIPKNTGGDGPGDIDKPFVFDQEGYDPTTFTFNKKERLVESTAYSWDVSVALPGGETNDYIYGIRVDDDGTVEYITSDGMYGDASGIPGEIFPIEVVEYMENYIKEKFPEDTLPARKDDGGPDEEPPSPGGGTPPKAPSPSTPGSPSLFGDFDAPAGAFQLRTTEYEPEGRIDEASTDFTDDPRRLATKFTLDDLVTAFTEALIGRPSDEALQDILDANVGDDDDLPDLDDLGDVANSPAPRAGEVSASGAGALEFNAGEEYVQAEALYNAVYEAGGDPNRVIANAYDAVNGNRNNARKLLEAQGGVPSQEESQLIEDMTDEIRQIKDATPEDDEISASQKRDKPEKTFKGELIENVPVDFNNPDYFDMDTDAYIPSAPEIDENGYTDNPEILALDYESTDLIEQMIEGITDGSGVALLDFGGEQGVGEVPVEALRDALQLQAYNTNKILFDLRDESNDMSEEEKPTLSREDIRWDAQKGLYTDVNGNVLDGDTVDAVGLDSSLIDAPAPDIQVLEPRVDADEVEQPTQREASVEFAPFSDALANLDEEDPSISPEIILSLDEAANSLVEMFSNGIPADARLAAYNFANGMLVVQTPGTDIQEASVITFHPNGGVMRVESDIDWFLDGGGIYGWKPMPDEVDRAIRQENAKRFPQEVAPESPAAPEAPASQFVYPGPREAGYSVNNTTLASDGSIVGAGSIVTANRDGKRGMVVSIQNDPEYVRIKFDDGKVAVRSANQIKAVSNPDGSLATAPSGALAPSAPSPATDVRERLEAPLRDAPNIARPGSAWGINDASTVPNRIAPFTQKDVPQSKFKAWRSRDAEIAKAANARASFDSLFKAAQAALIAKEDRSLDYPALMEEFEALLKDAYGTRDDLTFGADRYKVSVNNVTLSYGNGDIRDGNVSYQMHVRFDVLGENGAEVGGGSRYIRSDVTKNADGTTSHKTYVKNDVLKIFGTNQKKGFATAYNRHMENWYIANGVEKVKVLAYGGGSEWKGGFVWALNGFNWESGSSALSVARAIERAANTPQEKELATRLRERVSAADGDLSQMPLPIEMALIGWYNGADKWLGKEVMTNLSWEGVKHLDPGAREQMYSANYDQIKSAERRVRAGQNKANVSSVGLVQIMDNQFQDSNPELSPYMEQIRDALRNNRPLGFLSPSAKAALNSYVSNQLLNKDSKMPMDDLFRLRNALDAEYSADYGFADPFAGISESLVNFSLDDFFANSDALKEAGFEATPLGQYESGQNTTFKVIHKESGQVFFVKEESLSQEYNGERGVINEIEANTILNALGMHGLPAVRASRENQDVFIMSQAGATLPLANAAINADQMHYRGIVDTNGQASDYLNGTYLDVMANPEDILSMAIIDMLGDSEDRHDGNWMVAFDSTSGKMRIFPIDHGLIRIDTEDSSVRSFLLSNWPSAGEVYQRVIPRLIDKAGEARTKEMFLNQVEKLIKNLDNPLYQPKGEELAALISKWGSYEAFKDAMKERLTPILTPGTRENDGINKATKRAYWR